MVAAVPAVAVLWQFGSLEVETRILGLPIALTLAAGWVAMAISGAIYARLFGRAANQKRGGWLFGAAFAFAMWAAGAVLVLPLVSDGRMPAGAAALGLVVSLLVWGATLGLVLPYIHPLLHERIETGSKSKEVGPSAGTKKRPSEHRKAPPK
jgi:hypothetical protein